MQKVANFAQKVANFAQNFETYTRKLTKLCILRPPKINIDKKRFKKIL